MTLINFDLRAVAASGRVPADARIRWQPTERRVDGSVVILPEVHGVQLVAGVGSANLDPGYYWFTESNPAGTTALRLVPANGPVAYASLVAVDPLTLAPAAAPDPAWLAMARSTVDSGSVVGDNLVLHRTDGTTSAAGNVRGATGATPAMTVGVVSTGAPGSAAAASLTGTAAAPVLGLAIPRGDVGAKGDPGGITLGTDLGANDLNAITASGVYRKPSTGTGLLALHYPNDTDSGVLVVLERVPGSTIIQSWYSLGTSSGGGSGGYYYRVFNNAVWQPWRFVTADRVDQSAGRAIYAWDYLNGREQIIYGDTGWRDITATHFLKTTDSTPMPLLNGRLYIRRIGRIVYTMASDRLTIDRVAEPAAGVKIPDIAGFTENSGAGLVPWVWSQWDKTGLYALYRNGGWVAGSGPQNPFPTAGAGGASTTQQWPTNDAWPTSLPGVAVGTIPNL